MLRLRRVEELLGYTSWRRLELPRTLGRSLLLQVLRVHLVRGLVISIGRVKLWLHTELTRLGTKMLCVRIKGRCIRIVLALHHAHLHLRCSRL